MISAYQKGHPDKQLIYKRVLKRASVNNKKAGESNNLPLFYYYLLR